MAKITIPYLVFKSLANGAVGGYWEPSPALRRAGWTRLPLGTDMKAAIAAAERRNAEVEAWRTGGAKPQAVAAHVAPATFAHLVARYEAEHMDDAQRRARFEHPLADVTKREYRSAFAVLNRWAENGRTPIAAITAANIEVLKAALLRSRHAVTGEVKRHRAAGILRVLRMLLNFAHGKRLIHANPMDGVKVPQPAPRQRIISAAAITAVQAGALAIGRADVEFGVFLGLWTLQREADILAWTRANWRELSDLADEDRRVLAGADGKVMGFRLRQRKKKNRARAWVDIHAMPEVRIRVEAALAANAKRSVPVTALIADPDEPRATPDWKFQRGFRAAVAHALAAAQREGDEMLMEQLTGIQFRDLRRTGMCLMRELGLTVLYISSLSGHSIDDTTKILETYMPADTRTNAAAIAMLATRLGERAGAAARRGESA